VKKSFRPEFLNRLDEQIVFRRLGREDMVKVVEIQLGLFEKRLQGRGIQLQLQPPAKAFLVEHGYDPQYGARPLKRAISKHLENELAKKLLAGEFKQGDTILVGREGDRLTFSKASLN
jgi:ATP-dependent Clp protease ATP-binding subunit ClpB